MDQWYRADNGQRGFTLVEVMVAMVIALIILAGLVLSFNSQYTQYKYQNKRINTSQDLEFVSNFIANDIRDALVIAGAVQVFHTEDANGNTVSLTLTVWEPDGQFWSDTATQQANHYQAIRHYVYDPAKQQLSYDRNTLKGGDNPQPIMSNVTFFHVFTDAPGTAPAGFTGAPSGMPVIQVENRSGTKANVPGFTVLTEASVNAGYKLGSFRDVRGNNVGVRGLKRLWRYVQVHPQAAL